MSSKSILVAFSWFVLLASEAAAQQLNVLRIEPTGEGEGKTLQLGDFFYVGSPSFSKDGEWIAFDGYKGDPGSVTTECWVVRSDGTRPRRLARGATPRWSPDGKQLLFMREERADLGRPGGEGVGVFVINADGSDERHLCEGRWPEWSPNGKQIAFSVGGEPQGGARSGARICVANADGSEPREIAIGDCPSWSADGKRIACCYNDPAMPAPMIRVVDVGNRDDQKLLGFGWFRANWSADGKSLYCNGVNDQGQAGMVKLVAERRGAPEAILTKFVGQSPCPSPDGKSVVFCTIEEEAGDVQRAAEASGGAPAEAGG